MYILRSVLGRAQEFRCILPYDDNKGILNLETQITSFPQGAEKYCSELGRPIDPQKKNSSKNTLIGTKWKKPQEKRQSRDPPYGQRDVC